MIYFLLVKASIINWKYDIKSADNNTIFLSDTLGDLL
jgi:hypothetical protein